MEKALLYEEMLKKFFRDMETCLCSKKLNDSSGIHDRILKECFSTTKNQIYNSLCDSINTPLVLEHIRQLVSTTYTYMNKKTILNYDLLKNIAYYITYLINTFGLNSTESEADDIGFTRGIEIQTSTANKKGSTMLSVEPAASCHDAVPKEAIPAPNKVLPSDYPITDDILPGLDVRRKTPGIN
jgi:cysteinyl-tRNA synthetase